jgi:hypothetical protein
MHDEQQPKHLSDNQQIIKMMSINCVIGGLATIKMHE